MQCLPGEAGRVQTITQNHQFSELLEIDRIYRQQANEGTLRKIAPRRFNPSGKAWLPILHVDQEGWSYTALFSKHGAGA